MYKLALLILVAAFLMMAGPQALAQDETPDTAKAAPQEEATETAADATTPDEGEEAVEPDDSPAEDAAEGAAAVEETAAEGESGDAAAAEKTPVEGEPGDAEEAPAEEEESVADAVEVDPTAPYLGVTFAENEKPKVVMETNMGNMVLELWPDKAMKHCQSFVHLVRSGYFDSLTFHRVVPGFVIQGGDPNGNGTGGPGYNVPAEFNEVLHEDGILSMARAQDPNSAGSQFFICLGRLASLDNKYTVFGKVTEGLEVAHSIEKVPVTQERPNTPVVMTKVFMQE